MTRWARRSLDANEKKPHEASNWNDLSKRKASTSGSGVKRKSSQTVESSAEKFLKQRAASANSSNTAALEKEMMMDFMKRNRKREKRRLKRVDGRDIDKICFKCREKGHDMAACPQMKSTEEGAGICFKCGSTEHSLNQCRMKGSNLAYARCFICKETGHLSKQCPDNPRGLYPNGGCCRECGSVEHYRKDCPELQHQQADEDVTVERMDPFSSADAEPVAVKKVIQPSGPKIVNFK